MGLQVDFPVTLGGLETRAFVAIDGYGDESMPNNIAVSINSSTNAEVYTSNRIYRRSQFICLWL